MMALETLDLILMTRYINFMCSNMCCIICLYEHVYVFFAGKAKQYVYKGNKMCLCLQAAKDQLNRSD